MNVLFSYSAVGVGGDAIQTLALVAALRSGAHEVVLVGPNPVRPYDFVSPMFGIPWWLRRFLPLPVVEFTVDFGIQFVTLWRAAAATRTKRFDLVFHRGHIYDLVGGTIAKMAGCPLVVLLDAPHGEEWSMIGRPYHRRLNHFAIRRLVDRASLVVTVSEYSRQYFLNLGLPPSKVVVRPNGISREQLQQGLSVAREFPPFRSKDKATVGFIGNFAPWHRVDLLLEAMKRLELRGSVPYEALIVGHGAKFSECHSLSEKLGLQPHVTWTGPLPHPEAFGRLAEFDVAILPHTLQTGTPMKLLEYAAMARPIMAPNLPNIRELFEHGKDIWLYEPGNSTAIADGLEMLRRQPEFARELGKRAQEKMHRCTWEASVAEILRHSQTRSKPD